MSTPIAALTHKKTFENFLKTTMAYIRLVMDDNGDVSIDSSYTINTKERGKKFIFIYLKVFLLAFFCFFSYRNLKKNRNGAVDSGLPPYSNQEINSKSLPKDEAELKALEDAVDIRSTDEDQDAKIDIYYNVR